VVKVRYEDLAGESYETEWKINPLIYEGNRHVPPQTHPAVETLLSAVREVSENTGRESIEGTSRRSSVLDNEDSHRR